MKKKDRKAKQSSETNVKIPVNIFGNMKTKLPNLKTAAKQKTVACEVYDCEINELLRLIADIATGMWRIKNKFSANIEDLPDEIKKAQRHLESTLDVLENANIEIRGHSNERYVAGMALKVIAFQPTPSIKTERITETIKPSVFYKDNLIQMGQVIVETPDTTESPKNTNMNDVCENKERSGE